MQDYREIYSRELVIRPPAEVFLAGFFDYEPPIDTGPAVAEIPEHMTLPEYEA